jgi:hypothetical protein
MTLPLSKSVHHSVYLTGLILLSLGILYSCPVMSMSIMLLGANWLAEMNYQERIQRFLKNKTALVLSSIFFLHALGLLWSDDLHYGWDDVRTKIPLFVLPFLISTSDPLSKKEFRILLGFFITGIFVTTLISLFILKGIIPMELHDVRDISPFVSHIRLSLMLCLSIFVLAYYLIKTPSLLFRCGAVLLICWFIYFLTILESLTGLSLLVLIVFLLGLFYFNSYKPKLGKLALFFACLLLLGSAAYVYSIAKPFIEMKPMRAFKLEASSVNGMPFTQDTTRPYIENGNYVWLNVCWPELKVGWEKRSRLPFEGLDEKGNPLPITLLRYMTSKGYPTKDTPHIRALSDDDIRHVEKGITNCKYTNLSSLNARIYETIWELDLYFKGGNPSGHSVTMRFEFWKTGWHILKKNMLFGIGTGDVKNAFHNQYQIDHSALDSGRQLRAHDQYLTIAIALGIPGLLLFLVSLLYPLALGKMYRNYFYLVFWIIVVISMLTEDTLETQAGVTFYALFNALFLFAQPQEEGKFLTSGESDSRGTH